MTEQMVSDIPSGILACRMNGVEVKIKDISPFCVNILVADLQDECVSMEFHYFIQETGNYETVEVKDFQRTDVRKEEFFYLYSYKIEDQAFRDMVSFVFKQYYRYITLKMESYDNYFSEELVGYPSDLDEVFAETYEEWCKARENDWIDKIASVDQEIAISLENAKLWNAYLENHLAQYVDQRILNKCQRLYIGNSFCPHLFPNDKVLNRLLEKAAREGKKVSIVCSVLKEEQITVWKRRFCELMVDEYVINDWGYLPMLKNIEGAKIVLGVLLNKRRKDPRYIYKPGNESLSVAENSLNTEEMKEFLDRHGISRIEYELSGYDLRFALEKNSLHLPFSQTNTAGHCTLFALCKNGDRELQEEVRACPRYCESYVCVYPEHLNMVGRYNSLFMWNKEQEINGKVDRIVWNMG